MGCCESHESMGVNPKPIPINIPVNENVGHSKTNHPLYSGQLGQGSIQFKYESFAEAAQIYQKYIQSHVNEEVEIDGLGQYEMSIGYFEWYPYKWYKEGVDSGMYKGTVYDALSLCYLALKANDEEMEKAIKWYRQMVDDNPDNIPLIFGYANVLNNKAFYQEAMDYYNKVIGMKPSWARPLECIAYIYEYKRIEKSKSIQVSNKILALEPNNRVAMFVLARNQKNVDIKIERLIQVTKVHSKFGRAFNQIGIVYGGTKKEYKEAITWYKKAIEVTPLYSSCYNNVGVNNQLLKDYEQAMEWYFKGIQKDKEYKAPHANLIDIFKTLQYKDDDIQKQMSKYHIFPDYFYYYMGLAYYDKKNYDESKRYYSKAQDCSKELAKHIYKLHNSKGITHDDVGNNDEAIKCYNQCIQANPKWHSAYYNCAIIYKKTGQKDKAIEWYKKAIEINPRYSYAYNNLGNIYKDAKQYEDAIKCYKKAVDHLSTYTLALANMGVCCLKIENYRQAFNSLSRAKQILPTDNNNLSQGNKSFLKTTLENFDKEGESWRQNGGITPEQRIKLQGLIKSFQSNFNKLYANQGKEPVCVQKILKKQILQIVRIIHEDQFELTNIDKIYDLVKNIFEDNEEYFHIIPQLFMQYFYKNAFEKKRPILEIEAQLCGITKRLSAKTNASIKQDDASQQKSRQTAFKMSHFNPPTECKVNLFQNAVYFDDYASLYSEIMEVNNVASNSYQDYKHFIDYVRKQSYAIPYGIGMKIPKAQKDQFKVILRIFEKMFKKEINGDRVKLIIGKVDTALQQKQKSGSSSISIGDVVHDIMEIWTKEITEIVVQRKKNKTETKCEISDFLRAKLMYESVDHLKKAIIAVDEMCFMKGFKVIEMENRLAKQQTQDVVLKIQVKDAVCELQLAMKQDESQYHFIHSIYEIERSPLGCIFGSYIYMSKGFSYPFLENCRDIVEQLKNAKAPQDLKTLEAAKYIVSTLSEGPAK